MKFSPVVSGSSHRFVTDNSSVAQRQAAGIQQKRALIWLILGPSGTGKSSFGKWLAAERDWLHLEADRFREDGIDLLNLRAEWDEFYYRGNPAGLDNAVQIRLEANSKTFGVLTLPGRVILSVDQMLAATKAGMRTIYLYGSAAHCISAFVNRERRTPRGLHLIYWLDQSRCSYMRMSEPDFDPYRIHVFTHIGTHRPHADVFDELVKGESYDSQ